MVANNTEINITLNDYAEILRDKITTIVNLELKNAALKRTVIELQESKDGDTIKNKETT